MGLMTTWKPLYLLLSFLAISFRYVTSQTQATWVKANTSPVCFGAKDSKYGTFNMPFTGNLAALRLVNLHGYVTCDRRRNSYWSYWGCGSYNSQQINVVITDETNNVVFPQAELILNDSKWAIIPGYNSVSRELVMSLFNPRSVQSGQPFRLWYGEDLMNHGEGDNGGKACIDVYALTMNSKPLEIHGQI